MHTPYIGSGPYCYTNSLAMMLGGQAPPTAVIEVLTASPYGMQLIGGRLPLFDPLGWDPLQGLDEAIELLGWTCEQADGGDPGEALDRLIRATHEGPVLAGPLEMGLLTYQPGANGPIGVDHYVVVLEATPEEVLVHDPEGYPYATIPAQEFLAAWKAEKIDYLATPYAMRWRFVRHEHVEAGEALRRSLPRAERWLAGRTDLPVPAGTAGQGEAARRTAELVETGQSAAFMDIWRHFAIRVGARRLNDLAACLDGIGASVSARVAAEQARLVGALQLPAMRGDDEALVEGLLLLAPTYERLLETKFR
ncbi:MAG: hypothetical protein HOV86_10415 [Thermoactinospora sp.]|nr:hypothetical protein [Thermoactinospora sp.]